MPLRSNLFRSDSALQNCLVLDSAHVETGASGPHVAKIQQALNIVNRARIADQEIIDSSFGSSTADEVLKYKTDRAIINRSYQAKPDNVVGKMTIASLDEEMVRSESHRVRDCCTDPSLGGSTSPGRASRFTATSVGGEPVQRKFPGILSVFMQPALVKGNMGPQTMNIVRDMPKRAKELLSPFALDLRSIANFSFHFPFKIKFDQEDESDRLREAAEGTLPGFDQTLRVLIAPFRRNDAGDDDVTTNGFSRSSNKFNRFVVLNANILRADRGTLLHEMIHCIHPSLMSNSAHDSSDDSIFSWGPNRTVLRPELAEAFQKQKPFFFFPK